MEKDLLAEIVKRNDLRLKGNFDYSVKNGQIEIVDTSLDNVTPSLAITPDDLGEAVSTIGGAISKGVDATVEGAKGLVKGIPRGLGNFAVEFNKTFLPGFEENVVPFLQENIPGLKKLNSFVSDIVDYKNTAQEVGGGFLGEPLGEFGVTGGALSSVARSAGVTNRFISSVLGFGTAESIAVPAEEQGLLAMGIDMLAPDNAITKAILEGLASDEDASIFMQKLQKAPENIFAGGLIGEGLDKAVRSVGTLYKYIKNSPRLDSIKEELKGGISNLGDMAREVIEKDGGGTRLGANDLGNIIAQGVRAIDETVNPQNISNTGKPPSNLLVEEDLKVVLKERAKQMDLKPKDRVQPSNENPLFDTSRESYEKIMVEQKETYVPRNTKTSTMPLNNRTNKVVEKTDEIAKVLAERIEPFKGTNVQYFYHTGPIIQKAVEMGVPREQAEKQLYEFALNYAVTSPRTMTEQNLRNASLVATKGTLDIPLTEIVGPGMAKGINEKGYPMMIGPTGIHKKLTDEKKRNELNPDLNPKPITFAQNVLGNLEGVTVDTHAIRAVFDVMNELEPGSVPIEFIGGKNAKATKKFREMYKKDPSSLDVATMINDTLGTQMIDGKSMQTEYAIFSDLYKKVAELAGVRPAEAQSLSWFANGEKTGLSSEPKTVVDLINDRVDVTAQILKQDKETVFKKFFEGKLPLLAIPASVTLLDTGAMMEGEQ